MKWLKTHFPTDATFTASANPIAPNFTPGSLKGAMDIVMGRIVYALKADALLVAIFGDDDRIERMPMRPPFENRNLPRLQVTPGSRQPDTGPTNLELSRLFIDINLRIAAGDAFVPVPVGEADLGTLVAYIDTILHAHQSLLVTHGGNEYPLAMEGRKDPAGSRELVDIDTTGALHLSYVSAWTYRVDVIPGTAKIRNVFANGG